MKIICGTIDGAHEADLQGWIVGHMQEENSDARTRDFEIKMWRYLSRILPYDKTMFMGKECISIFGGVIVLHLEKGGVRRVEELVGERMDYIIIEPGVTKRVEVKRVPAFGQIVRWPSVSGMNIHVE